MNDLRSVPALSPSAATSGPRPHAEARAQQSLVPLIALALAHVVLGVLVRMVPSLALVHAAACVTAGVVIAAIRPVRHTAYVVAYIAGSEILWRMSRAGVFWEFGKYSVAIVLLVAILRIGARRNRAIIFGYLFLLLPSCLLTLTALDVELARKYVSFFLSGPLALTLCVLYFSNVRLRPQDIRGVFLTLILPVISISMFTYLTTANAVDLSFTNESNAVTSGGFSATQVSPILGLAFLFSLLLLLERGTPWRMRALLIASALLFAVQSALTFSRGGLALAFAAAMAAVLYLVRDRRTRITLVVLASLFVVVGKYVVIPRLQDFTKGKFAERYTTTDTSGRAQLALYDLEIFRENPVLGVGPGMATELHEEMGHSGSAHTEFTRLAAEHGILGLGALFLLGILTLRALRATHTLRARALVSAILIWVALFFLIYAMRVVAPAFMFGMALCIGYSSRPRPAPR